MTPTEVQEALTAIVRKLDPSKGKAWQLSISMVYNCRNAYARPGRDLANAISELTKGVVSTTSWPATAVRPRKPAPKKRKRSRAKPAPVAKAA
jgi:hypothetical protein